MPAPYPLEFRREAVELLKRSGKSVPVLASELGVSPQSLRNWARQIDIDEGRRDGLSSDERDELRRLLAVAAVQGVIFRIVRFVVDRYGAIGFHYLTGVWPGEKRPDRDDD